MCKRTMAPLWLGFLSTALHALLVSSSPTSTRNTDLQSSPCVSFKLGSASIEQLYNTTYSPNPLFPSYLPTVDRALVEAKLIFPLATASNCSKHIGEFLLYAYLPQCFVFQTTIILVFPCVDFCQRIRSCCASGLLASNGISWPQWLDCDNIGAAISNYQNVCYSPPSYADDQNCPQPTGTASAATSASATMTAPTATSSSAGTTASQSLPPTVAPTTSSQPINPSGVPGCSYFRFSPWSEQYYDTTYAPNPLSPAYLPTVESALREARLIFPSALASNCSSHIGEFLLYAYFPQCYFSPPNTYGVVLPCQDFCVAIQSCCSSVLATYGIQWPEWLSCGKIGAAISSSSNPNICFRPPLNETDSKCLPVAATTQPTTSRATMPRPATTSPPSPPPCYCNSTCNSCNIRTNVTSATFTVANFDYSFAAKVYISSIRIGTCNTTYGLTVIESYLPCPNSTTVPQFPPSKAEITTYTLPCNSCFTLSVGQTYWVGGSYYVNCRGQPVWEIPRVKGVAAPWVAKYDDKGPAWVQAARREHGC